MNFIIDLFFNKRRDVIYDSILIIINRCIKMIKYISITTKIDIVTLTKFFYEKFVLRFDVSNNIINDKNFVFTNIFDFRCVIVTINLHIKLKSEYLDQKRLTLSQSLDTSHIFRRLSSR